jgi:membrane fusion protein, multidrug efflux system
MIKTADFMKRLIKYQLIKNIFMKRSLIIIIIVLTAEFLITNCSTPTNNNIIKNSKADSVTVFNLKKVPVKKKLSFPAELIPIEKAELYAKVNGYVKEIKVDIGDHVKKGQLLVILDAPEILSAYSEASSEVQTARSKYLSSLDNYKRILSASKVDGTIAGIELERFKNQMLADSSSVEAAKSKLNVSAQFKNYLTMCSPFDGVVTQRNCDAGVLTGVANTRPLLVIENVKLLRLRIPVPEIYSAAVPDTSFIGFSVEANPGKTYYAVLSRKSGSINLSNRTETWEFIYENSENLLKPGMFANAMLKLGREELSFLVPASAIATTLEKKFVIRLNDGKAEWIDVKSGFSQNENVEIFGSLQEGDLLLIGATEEVKPGTKFIAKLKK